MKLEIGLLYLHPLYHMPKRNNFIQITYKKVDVTRFDSIFMFFETISNKYSSFNLLFFEAVFLFNSLKPKDYRFTITKDGEKKKKKKKNRHN